MSSLGVVGKDDITLIVSYPFVDVISNAFSIETGSIIITLFYCSKKINS